MSDDRDVAALSSSLEPAKLPRAGAAGIVAAGLVAGTVAPHARGGLSVFLIAVAIACAVVASRPRDLSMHELVFGGIALVLAGVAIFRTAGWLISICVLAAAYIASFAVTRSRTWRGLFTAPMAAVAMLPWVPRVVGEPVIHKVKSRGTSGVASFFRTAGVSAALLVLFGALFVSADPAFARLANEILLPDVDVTSMWSRLLSFGVAAATAGGLVLAKPSMATSFAPGLATMWERMRDHGPAPRPTTRKLIEWVVPIAALDVLFGAFVAVQMTTLFGGETHVEVTPGLTYAEYARQGFFQLVAVAVLVLIVIAFAVHLVRSGSERDRRVAQVLLGGLCVLTLVVLASAWYRLAVYQDAYGLTRLRVSVYGAIAWLGVVFALVMIAGALWRGTWLPRAVVASAAVGLIAFCAANPDALIARQNVTRFEATGDVDLGYLASLSEDAVPELARLPAGTRECVLAYLAWDRGTMDDRGWAELNLARSEARRELERLDIPEALPAGCLETLGLSY